MIVSPLWHRPGNIHGFVLSGKIHRPGWATVKVLHEPAVSGVRITTLCTCNLINIGGALSQIRERSQAIILSNQPLDTMPKQQQRSFWQQHHWLCFSHVSHEKGQLREPPLLVTPFVHVFSSNFTSQRVAKC